MEVDGHDPLALYKASQNYEHKGPLLIKAKTHPCRGMTYLGLADLPLDFVRFRDARSRLNFEAALRAELYKPNTDHT